VSGCAGDCPQTLAALPGALKLFDPDLFDAQSCPELFLKRCNALLRRGNFSTTGTDEAIPQSDGILVLLCKPDFFGLSKSLR
jgi:hypothetical protein